MDPRPVDVRGNRSFTVVRTLGEGTFGSVYLADMASAGGFRRRVALKLLHATWEAQSEAAQRLRDEARLLGRLQHRHIVRVDDLLQVGGRWALLMEYVAGVDVETLIDAARTRGVTIPARAVLQIGSATAAALDAAYHTPAEDGQPLRVIHRDIKPSNIRVSETGEVKVLDFGIAHAEFAGREARTERFRYGSIGYMAPQRLLGEPDTRPSDVYSLGVVLVELLTLQSYGRCELGQDKQRAQVDTACAALDARVGPEIAACIRSMLSYDADGRPSARDVEATLRRAAAALSGPDLQDFCADAFSGLVVAGAEGPDAAMGTELHEGTGSVSVLPTLTSRAPSSATLIVGDLEDTEVAAPAAPSSARPRAWALGAGVLIGVLGAGALLSVLMPAEPPAAPVLSLPARAPSPPRVPSGEAAAPAAPVESAAALVEPATSPAASPSPAAPPSSAASPAASPSPAVSPAASSAPAVSPEVPRLRAAKVVVTGGEGVSVTCGDVTASGATNALLREFPAGACSVTVGGAHTTVRIDAPRQVDCTLADGSLTCR